MSSEDCQWGIFDFSNTLIDPQTGHISQNIDEDGDDKKKNNLNYEECCF